MLAEASERNCCGLAAGSSTDGPCPDGEIYRLPLKVDQGCGRVRPCTQANCDGGRILVRLGTDLYAKSSADVRSVEVPQDRAAEISQLAAAGLLSWRQLPSRHRQTMARKDRGDRAVSRRAAWSYSEKVP